MSTAKQVDWLFLDVGGVMLTNGWGRGSRKAACEKYSLDFDELDSRHRMTFDTFEIGKLSWEEYINRIVFYEERPFTREDFTTFALSRSQPYPEMIDYIKELRERHRLRIAVVSNEGRELTEHRIQTFRLNEFVDFFVSSCYVHFRKPDVDMYQMALDLAQVAPDRVAYVDDRSMFVEVASRMGIRGIHHTDIESTRAELEKLGLH